ncbi:MAG: competence protein ComK [bacterium]|nr:competence protein ComK [bacterium]
MIKEYEIGRDTLAIFPIDNNSSYVYEGNDKILINATAKSIINHSCKFYGSSLEGRKEGITSIISSNVKPPIIIEETNNIIFFPTASSRNYLGCKWISYNNILKYYSDDGGTVIVFVNNVSLKLDVSYRIIDNQITRIMKLINELSKRRNISFGKDK